ncbi:MAG: hypothetical protein HQL30_06305 [Candidatus Omnitrophica bacterium]|nr:hypothetical protein [Candidatus Omnitrophota bacterium]
MYRKIISIIIIATFSTSSLPITSIKAFSQDMRDTINSYTDRSEKTSLSINDELLEISMPSSLATFNKTQGAGNKLVIAIKDAHCNIRAQEQISKILLYLNDNYGLKTVNMEGAKGEFDLSVFTSEKEIKVREKVMRYFMEKGTLTGAEFTQGIYPERFYLWGIEDPGLYGKNLEAYKNAARDVSSLNLILSRLEFLTDVLKARLFNGALLEIDKNSVINREEDRDFKDIIGFYIESCDRSGIDLSPYGEVKTLKRVIEAEKNINFKTARMEGDKVLDLFKKRASNDLIRRFTSVYAAMKNGDVSEEAFYGFLIERAPALGIDIKTYPELMKYLAYLRAYCSINKTVLYSELGEIEKTLREKAFENADERELFGYLDDLTSFKKFSRFSLNREEYDRYKSGDLPETLSKIKSFIAKYIPEGNDLATPEVLWEIDRNIRSFYERSFERDEKFAENIRFDPAARIGGVNMPEAAVIVTGGFHESNLFRIFEKKGISCISLTPKFVSDKDMPNPYFALLSGKGTELDSFMGKVMADPSGASLLAIKCLFSEMGVDTRERKMMEIEAELVKHLFRYRLKGERAPPFTIKTPWGYVVITGDKAVAAKANLSFGMEGDLGVYAYVFTDSRMSELGDKDSVVDGERIVECDGLTILDGGSLNYKAHEAWVDIAGRETGSEKMNETDKSLLLAGLKELGIEGPDLEKALLREEVRVWNKSFNGIRGHAGGEDNGSRVIYLSPDLFKKGDGGIEAAKVFLHELGAAYLLGHDENKRMEDIVIKQGDKARANQSAVTAVQAYFQKILGRMDDPAMRRKKEGEGDYLSSAPGGPGVRPNTRRAELMAKWVLNMGPDQSISDVLTESEVREFFTTFLETIIKTGEHFMGYYENAYSGVHGEDSEGFAMVEAMSSVVAHCRNEMGEIDYIMKKEDHRKEEIERLSKRVFELYEYFVLILNSEAWLSPVRDNSPNKIAQRGYLQTMKGDRGAYLRAGLTPLEMELEMWDFFRADKMAKGEVGALYSNSNFTFTSTLQRVLLNFQRSRKKRQVRVSSGFGKGNPEEFQIMRELMRGENGDNPLYGVGMEETDSNILLESKNSTDLFIFSSDEIAGLDKGVFGAFLHENPKANILILANGRFESVDETLKEHQSLMVIHRLSSVLPRQFSFGLAEPCYVSMRGYMKEKVTGRDETRSIGGHLDSYAVWKLYFLLHDIWNTPFPDNLEREEVDEQTYSWGKAKKDKIEAKYIELKKEVAGIWASGEELPDAMVGICAILERRIDSSIDKIENGIRGPPEALNIELEWRMIARLLTGARMFMGHRAGSPYQAGEDRIKKMIEYTMDPVKTKYQNDIPSGTVLTRSGMSALKSLLGYLVKKTNGYIYCGDESYHEVVILMQKDWGLAEEGHLKQSRLMKYRGEYLAETERIKKLVEGIKKGEISALVVDDIVNNAPMETVNKSRRAYGINNMCKIIAALCPNDAEVAENGGTVKELDHPFYMVVDNTLLGSNFQFANYLTGRNIPKNLYFIEFSSLQKFYQDGEEMCIGGKVTVWTPDEAAKNEAIAGIMRMISMMGVGMDKLGMEYFDILVRSLGNIGEGGSADPERTAGEAMRRRMTKIQENAFSMARSFEENLREMNSLLLLPGEDPSGTPFELPFEIRYPSIENYDEFNDFVESYMSGDKDSEKGVGPFFLFSLGYKDENMYFQNSELMKKFLDRFRENLKENKILSYIRTSYGFKNLSFETWVNGFTPKGQVEWIRVAAGEEDREQIRVINRVLGETLEGMWMDFFVYTLLYHSKKGEIGAINTLMKRIGSGLSESAVRGLLSRYIKDLWRMKYPVRKAAKGGILEPERGLREYQFTSVNDLVEFIGGIELPAGIKLSEDEIVKSAIVMESERSIGLNEYRRGLEEVDRQMWQSKDEMVRMDGNDVLSVVVLSDGELERYNSGEIYGNVRALEKKYRDIGTPRVVYVNMSEALEYAGKVLGGQRSVNNTFFFIDKAVAEASPGEFGEIKKNAFVWNIDTLESSFCTVSPVGFLTFSLRFSGLLKAVENYKMTGKDIDDLLKDNDMRDTYMEPLVDIFIKLLGGEEKAAFIKEDFIDRELKGLLSDLYRSPEEMLAKWSGRITFLLPKITPIDPNEIQSLQESMFEVYKSL